jgi:methylase of polypeptide subunit release factors
MFESSNYTEDAVCDRLHIESIFDFRSTLEAETKPRPMNDALDFLISMLMDGESVSESRLKELLPEGAVETFEDLGILGRDDDFPGKCFATAFLYPVESLYIASDRTIPPNRKSEQLPDDVVYAAITANTRRFLASLPQTACGTFLDLCSGTGIAALVAAKRYAQHAWSCDITERSERFAEFNRCLNGLENVTVARGDLYEAIGNRSFDRIVAHPPYIPAWKDRATLFFRDGGKDGEEILQKIIQGLPAHLSPDGRFYCVTLATDRENETFEQRIRRWLGPDERDFDVVLVASEVKRKPEEIIAGIIARGWLNRLSPTIALYEELKVTAMFYGAVMVHRKSEHRPAATGRALKSVKAGQEVMEWVYQWETAAVTPAFSQELLDDRPRHAPHMKLVVTHTPEEEGLIPTAFALKSDYPIVIDATCAPWLAVVLGACNGSMTGMDIYKEMKEQNVLEPNMTAEDFANVLRLLGSSGVIEFSGHPLPASGDGHGKS